MPNGSVAFVVGTAVAVGVVGGLGLNGVGVGAAATLGAEDGADDAAAEALGPTLAPDADGSAPSAGAVWISTPVAGVDAAVADASATASDAVDFDDVGSRVMKNATPATTPSSAAPPSISGTSADRCDGARAAASTATLGVGFIGARAAGSVCAADGGAPRAASGEACP